MPSTQTPSHASLPPSNGQPGIRSSFTSPVRSPTTRCSPHWSRPTRSGPQAHGSLLAGPLTLLLPRSAAVPDAVTAGRPLVGIRMPAHPVAFELIREAGVPVAAPSANVFGHISPTTAAHVLEDLDGRIDAVLDGGPTEHGVESTVLDPNQTPMVIYRPGAITAEQIRAVAGPVELFHAAPSTPRRAARSTAFARRWAAPLCATCPARSRSKLR